MSRRSVKLARPSVLLNSLPPLLNSNQLLTQLPTALLW